MQNTNEPNHYFDTPFDMYEMIAEYFEKTNNLFRSISVKGVV